MFQSERKTKCFQSSPQVSRVLIRATIFFQSKIHSDQDQTLIRESLLIIYWDFVDKQLAR